MTHLRPSLEFHLAVAKAPSKIQFEHLRYRTLNLGAHMRRGMFSVIVASVAAGQPFLAFAQAPTRVVGFLSGAVPNPAIDKRSARGGQ